MPEPYILAMSSHKGGTGRTTTALMLAWALGQTGRSVALIDADEQRSAGLIAVNGQGHCSWPNVTFRAGPDALDGRLQADVVVIDPPALTAPSVHAILRRAHGIVLTCLADPLSIRTVPAAATSIENARAANSEIELLGLIIGIYNDQDAVQSAMLERLRQSHSDLLLEPVVPFQVEVRDWPLHPGAAPPPGPARDACVALAKNLLAVCRL